MNTSKEAFTKGLGFGLTSGVVTTLSILIGLDAVSDSKPVIIGGIITIAIADAVSDALGIHISEESQGKTKHIHIWTATVTTFLSKFSVGMSFLIPVTLFDVKIAIILSVIWGFFLITVFSYITAVKRKENPFVTIIEHTVITGIVLTVIHFTGKLIDTIFKL